MSMPGRSAACITVTDSCQQNSGNHDSCQKDSGKRDSCQQDRRKKQKATGRNRQESTEQENANSCHQDRQN